MTPLAGVRRAQSAIRIEPFKALDRWTRRELDEEGERLASCTAEERVLNHRALLERPRQLVPLEAGDARPEADVHRRRVLRLEAPFARALRGASALAGRAGAGARAARG